MKGSLNTRVIRYSILQAAQKTRTWVVRNILSGRKSQDELRAEGHPHSRIRPKTDPLPINDRLGNLRQRTRVRETTRGIVLSFPNHIVMRRHTDNSRMQNRPWREAVMAYIDRVLKIRID